MVDQPEIHIGRLIIHKVDHLKYDAAQLADLESPVADKEVASFLRQHIVSGREHRYTRTARFLPPKEDKVCLRDLCDTLLAQPSEFVEQSRRIAEHLFDTIDKRVSPGDLILCTFTEGKDKAEWLALLKMDPEDGFVGVEEKVDGRVRYRLLRVPNVLPRGELQKCAFILPPKLGEKRGYDLKVLDQQAARYGARRLIASFFVLDFLQCRAGLEPRDSTRAFVYGSHEWLSKKKGLWPEDEFERFKARVTGVLQDRVVDVTSFAAAVITNPNEQDEYLEFMREEGLEDLTFEPDPKEQQRLTRYTWFEGDHDLRVRIESEHVGPGKTLSYRRDPATNDWIVTIRTAHWEEQLKRGRR